MSVAIAIAIAPALACTAEAKEHLHTVELMADHEAEAGPIHIKWSARPVVKSENQLWAYAPSKKAPAPTETEGPEVKLQLPGGAWEVQAEGRDGSHGRVILQVDENLQGTMLTVTDAGEPYPPEGEPTQWFVSPTSNGPQLTGAPPMTDTAEIRLETPRVLREGKPVQAMVAGPDSVIETVIQLPKGFIGKVEMRDAKQLRAKPFFSIAAAQLAAKPQLPCPEKPGFYEIRLVDQHRRRVASHVVHLE